MPNELTLPGTSAIYNQPHIYSVPTAIPSLPDGFDPVDHVLALVAYYPDAATVLWYGFVPTQDAPATYNSAHRVLHMLTVKESGNADTSTTEVDPGDITLFQYEILDMTDDLSAVYELEATYDRAASRTVNAEHIDSYDAVDTDADFKIVQPADGASWQEA